MKWTGNLTLKMDEKEDTYGPGSIQVERYAGEFFKLKLTDVDNRAGATAQFNKDELKTLINELTQSL
ncbi:unnamed protein product [marine sediment metagenome]|uniref:Uncharacterized protein n=1 Tax=marine sediment metagenome TaxID=412755 RepID=X1R153_9ZZZZ